MEQFREFPANTEYFILEPNISKVEDVGWRYLAQHLDLSLIHIFPLASPMEEEPPSPRMGTSPLLTTWAGLPPANLSLIHI